jgi:hypothetical protein
MLLTRLTAYMDATTMASLRMGNGNGKKSSIHTDELDNGEVIQVGDILLQRHKTLLTVDRI